MNLFFRSFPFKPSIAFLGLSLLFNFQVFTATPRVEAALEDESVCLLMHAAIAGDLETIKVTLFERAGINVRSANDLTALHYAILADQEEAALYLIECGANILLQDRWGNTPLILAKSRNMTKVIEAIEQKFIDYQSMYLPADLKEYESNKHFAIIVPSYNNSEWVKKGLTSIFTQKYENYHVLFVDDCSKDGNDDLAEQYIQECGQEHRCQVIRNHTRKYKMANLYHAIHRCQDSDIIVILDGDDWFSDDEVFSHLNNLYKKNDLWLTAGGYKEYPSNIFGFCRPVPSDFIIRNAFREYGGTTSQLRTFYAWLFKQLSLEDLFYEGKFFKTTSDVAKMMPMFELAGERIKCLDRVVYVYNLSNAINDHKVDSQLQTRSCEDIIQRKKRYTRLSNPLPSPEKEVLDAKASVLVFLEEDANVVDLKNKLNFIHDKDQVFVLCENQKTYQKCESLIGYPHLTIFKQKNEGESLSTYLQKIIASFESDYIFFVDGTDHSLRSPLSLNLFIRALKKTHAYSWQLKRAEDIENNQFLLENIQEDIFAWQFSLGQDDWKTHTLDMGLYRKSDILKQVKKIPQNCSIFSLFKNLWRTQETEERAVGLCSKENKYE